MGKNVADVMWEILANSGVRRCYGIVGDALNPVVDALRRNGRVEFVHVRHEEWGVFAANAEARLTGNPVVVCGTAGPGVAHLLNGLLDARKEGVPVIALAGDVETSIMDTEAVEELNPYHFFQTASLYTGRLVDPRQTRTIVTAAVTTALAERGPTVISLPGDVAVAEAPPMATAIALPDPFPGPGAGRRHREGRRDRRRRGDRGDLRRRRLRTRAGPRPPPRRKLHAPVGFSLKGKNWLEHDNPHAVGMTGLLGYGGCWKALHECDVLLMLGTDMPFSEFLPQKKVQVVQIDRDPGAWAAACRWSSAWSATSRRRWKSCCRWCGQERRHVPAEVSEEDRALAPATPALCDRGAAAGAHPPRIPGGDAGPARRQRRGGHRRHRDRLHLGRALSPARPSAAHARLVLLGVDGQRLAERLRREGVPAAAGDRAVRRRRFHHAGPRRPHHRGPARGAEVVHVVLNNGRLDFVWIEMQEAGLQPFGVDFQNPDLARVAEALGAHGIRVERPGDVEAGLAEALRHRGGHRSSWTSSWTTTHWLCGTRRPVRRGFQLSRPSRH